jgi:hypothetical protein
MLPTCLLLLLLIFLALSSHMVLNAIPPWGQAPSSGRRAFGFCQVHFGLPARTNKIGCVALVSGSRIRTEGPSNSLDVVRQIGAPGWANG